MNELTARFEQAALAVKKLTDRPDNDTLLELYAFYKQGCSGDVTGERPGFFDFVAAAKYEAWERLAGMPRENAMRQYVDLVERLGGKVDG